MPREEERRHYCRWGGRSFG